MGLGAVRRVEEGGFKGSGRLCSTPGRNKGGAEKGHKGDNEGHGSQHGDIASGG
jgi:hypothetical protein